MTTPPKRSRAYDPTYRPTKTFQQLWEEAGKPDTGGPKMMAERERLLGTRFENAEPPPDLPEER